LEGKPRATLDAIYKLGVSPADANLLNCHVVDGNVVVVVVDNE
jgi:hypothetical protein